MAARRETVETVWINTDIRKTPELDALSASAFRLWVRLPFLVDDQHRAPELAVIADDLCIVVGEYDGEYDVARLMSELVAAGFVDALDDGAMCMSALSRRFYAFTDPEGGEMDA